MTTPCDDAERLAFSLYDLVGAAYGNFSHHPPYTDHIVEFMEAWNEAAPKADGEPRQRECLRKLIVELADVIEEKRQREEERVALIKKNSDPILCECGSTVLPMQHPPGPILCPSCKKIVLMSAGGGLAGKVPKWW